MLYYFTKTLVSALLIVAVSEISKRYSLMGAIFASVPLTSVLAMIWLYHDTKDTDQVSRLSGDIFWLVIPSLPFFLIFPLLLKNKVSFHISLLLSLTIMVILYFIMIFILKKFGIRV